jgi:iron complex transport system substrate-binding protein
MVILILIGAVLFFPSALWGITDEIGREVQIPSKIERIVSMAPNITEILFALGVGEKIVGVTDYCDYPEEAGRKSKIGGFINPNFEAVVALRPNLVLATADGNPPDVGKRLEGAGIPVYVINPTSLSGTMATIQKLGTVIGVPRQGDLLASKMMERIAEVQERVAQRSKITTFLVLSRDPLITVNSQTVFGSLVEVAGGINVAAHSPIRYPRYSWEALLLDDPEVLVFAQEEADFFSNRWKKLSAVRGGRTCSIPIDLLERPGPRLVEGLEILSQCLHSSKEGIQ